VDILISIRTAHGCTKTNLHPHHRECLEQDVFGAIMYINMYLACRRTTSWRCTRRAVELVLRRSSRTGLATIQSDWSCDDPVGLVLRRSSRTGRATIQSDWSCDDPVGLVVRRFSRTGPATIQSDWSCDDPVGLVLRQSSRTGPATIQSD